ncbi:MAG: CGNR zinc finger domain-containing protein [Parvularculaceae bacterium]
MKISPSVWTSDLMVAGDPAVDFVNTLSQAETDPIDRLGGPEALAEWTEVAGLASAKAASRMKEDIRQDPAAAAAIYGEASAFRSALQRIFAAAAKGRAAGPADLRQIDDWLRRGASSTVIRARAGAYERAFSPDAAELEKPLIEIARAAEHLLLEGHLGRLHECAGEGCGWMFVDTSKNGRRRWCSMATCGTSAKVKKFRSRKKTKPAD